jgi:16S rRNA (cytosine967-C5)-methyltransferase
MSADPVRRLALDVLVAVDGGAPLESSLETALDRLADRRARDFLSELVRGSLRFRGRYDHLVNRLSHRPGMKRPPELQAVLRLSLHQLVGCDGVPAYAAVHQGAELCRAVVSPRFVPYVNALLQGAARALAAGGSPREALRSHFPDPGHDPAGWLTTWESHPRWLVERWLRRWEPAACAALCAHDNRAAPLTFHVLAPHDVEATAARLAAAGWPAARGSLHDRALVLAGRPGREELRALLAAEPGLIVQDEGAQAATAWLAAGGGALLLDLCAAPGGKTFHLRALGPASGLVVAMDRSRGRLALLVETAKRIEAAGLPVLLADGEAPPLRDGIWGAILLDGPCSGTGVLRHHPEGRWRLSARRLGESAARLRRLGLRAAGLLAPAGRLLYVTCSLEPEENGEVVRALVAADAGLEPDPHPDPAWERAWLPQETGSDGFYAARLRRKGESA